MWLYGPNEKQVKGSKHVIKRISPTVCDLIWFLSNSLCFLSPCQWLGDWKLTTRWIKIIYHKPWKILYIFAAVDVYIKYISTFSSFNWNIKRCTISLSHFWDMQYLKLLHRENFVLARKSWYKPTESVPNLFKVTKKKNTGKNLSFK
jgi:hypothetical protein